MKAEYSPDGTVVRISGDYSPHPVIAAGELVALLGGPEPAYHAIKQVQCLLPHQGSSAHPLTLRDWHYTLQNQQHQARCWRWLRREGSHVREDTGYDFVFGYAFRDEQAGVDVFVDSDDRPVFRVRFSM